MSLPHSGCTPPSAAVRPPLWLLLSAGAAVLAGLGAARVARGIGQEPAPVSPSSITDGGGRADGPAAGARVRHFLETYCFECHGGGAAKGGLALDRPEGLTAREEENLRRHVLLRTMPPADHPAPAPAARELFEEDLAAWQASRPAPGPVPAFRRLSSREFAGSVFSVLGAVIPPEDLPDSESAHGFDNNADFQPLPAALLERYAVLIRQAVRRRLLPAPVPVSVSRYGPQEFTGAGELSPDSAFVYETETNGPVLLPVNPPAGGRYRFSLTAHAHQAGGGPVQAVLQESAPLPVRALRRTAPEMISTTVSLTAGPQRLSFRLDNPLADPHNPDPHRRMRRLLVQEAVLEGPLEGSTEPAPGFTATLGPVPPPGASLDARLRAAGAALTRFTSRAWRRPVSDPEVTRLTRLAGTALGRGLRYDEALALAVEAALLSPNFLYLPDPASLPPETRAPATAARLSYLLWSGPPDDTLLEETRRLPVPGSPALRSSSAAAAPPALPGWTAPRLRAAAARMLDDPRAAAFARDFAGQWLQLRNVELARPDPSLFPEATPAVRSAMRASLEQFFLHLVRANEPVTRLLDADYLFCSPVLAAFAGLPGPDMKADGSFRPVSPANADQRGLLGHPGVLMLTSHPNRTSPVLRGKYVLETLLGLEPPPPPPNVPTLQADPPSRGTEAFSAGGTHSVRQALARHLADPSCAACHRVIDPLGLPLEAFDAVGRPLSAAIPGHGDNLPDLGARTFTGAELSGPASLSRWLVEEYGLRIVRHTTERLMTYALGRGLTPAERQETHALADRCGGGGARFRDLLMAVISTPVFRGGTMAPAPVPGASAAD